MARANATPVYMEEYPAFSVAPVNDVPVRVDREELTFRIDRHSSNHAVVTAVYTLSNMSGEKLAVPMIFPFISSDYRDGAGAQVFFNGQAVPCEVYNAGSVDVRDYLKEPDRFNKQADIDTIIENLNQPLYRAKHFDDTADAVLYRVTYRAPAGRDSRISFRLDPAKTRIVTFGFNGFEWHADGSCALTYYVGEGGPGDTCSIWCWVKIPLKI